MAVFEFEDDAQRFMQVLPKRLEKFGLRLNQSKTQLLAFGKRQAWQGFKHGERLPTLDFLGLTHYWGKSRNGKTRLKRKTSKKRYRRALVTINQWLCQERNALKLPALWLLIGAKMRGHFNYFGVTDNTQSLYKFERAVHAVQVAESPQSAKQLHMGDIPALSSKMSSPEAKSPDITSCRLVNDRMKRLVREIRRRASVRGRLSTMYG
jgi:hypothetical protein